MKSARTLAIVALLLLVASPLLGQPASSQGQEHAAVLIPDSSLEHAGDAGMRAHTNHLIKFDPDFVGTSPAGETPASIQAVYNIPSLGGAGTIAIVDAFHYATAANDLSVFSQTFSLPAADFRVVFAAGKQPRANCGWAQEAALDIEWAHAMAPNAKIVLVEAASNSFANLFQAVDVASAIVAADPLGGQVSMSWGGSEFSSEATNDSHMVKQGVVFFASSGDTGGTTIYPGTSPNVVSAGGTTIHRDKNGNFTGETGWSGSGGGPSKFEPRPSYQNNIAGIVGSARGVPDFSFDADPNSGVSVYDSTRCQGASGWLVFGGTSVSSPSLAGIVNSAGGATSSAAELGTIYGNLGSANFRDITSGTAGSFTAVTGWDFVTGVGSNVGLNGK